MRKHKVLEVSVMQRLFKSFFPFGSVGVSTAVLPLDGTIKPASGATKVPAGRRNHSSRMKSSLVTNTTDTQKKFSYFM